MKKILFLLSLSFLAAHASAKEKIYYGDLLEKGQLPGSGEVFSSPARMVLLIDDEKKSVTFGILYLRNMVILPQAQGEPLDDRIKGQKIVKFTALDGDNMKPMTFRVGEEGKIIAKFQEYEKEMEFRTAEDLEKEAQKGNPKVRSYIGK